MGEAGWIAVALSSDIEPGALAGVIVDGGEWVVWRDNAGAAHFWEDRCPHRGMRMSFGFVRGDRLACLYHGWQYDGGGQCRLIPAHPELEVPATIRAVTFPTVEAGGLIWTCLAKEAPSETPDFGEAVPVRSLYVDAPLASVAQALELSPAPPYRAGPQSHEAKPVEGVALAWVISTGADRLLIAAHPIHAQRSALHIGILGASADYAGAGQAHFARWAERLRHDLETAAAAWEAA